MPMREPGRNCGSGESGGGDEREGERDERPNHAAL